MLASIQRRAALRVACAYRTMSEAAIRVIDRAVPIDLMAREWARIHNYHKTGTLTNETRKAERESTLTEGEYRWKNETRDRWTARLIPTLNEWLQSMQGNVDYFLTQLLSGHGQFNSYLHRMGQRRTPFCVYCEGIRQTTLNTISSRARDGEKKERTLGDFSNDLRTLTQLCHLC